MLNDSETPILNEVLSLNAQELNGSIGSTKPTPILNEVLSLNAQESSSGMSMVCFPSNPQ